MNAAGTLGKEALDYEITERNLDALVTKTITPEPRAGNPPPRLAETPSGIINSVGLQNPGIDRFLNWELEVWLSHGLPVVVSVAGGEPKEVVDVCMKIKEDGRASAIEVNLSCPNILYSRPASTSPHRVARIVQWARYAWKGPLIAKLGFEDCQKSALAAVAGGVGAITLINTVPALSWITDRSKPLRGGLSGPAIKPIALRAVYDVAKDVETPIIGCGGIVSHEDVNEFLLCGARAVQIGSGAFGVSYG